MDSQYFSDIKLNTTINNSQCRDSNAALVYAKACIDDPDVSKELAAVLAIVPEQRDRIKSIIALSCVGEGLLNSFFSHSDTVGPLMRRKLAPWTLPILEQIRSLRQ